ncbi:bifunctional Lysine methyltransferase/S-adenosyl-L-methionine-dependent methyltransferase superfamily [Babesia duncani]|uniref:protein-histidine N-methyltransferase n=1 Tax=Babesia duncani TaxID=323732 RepID=A0AAD9PM79_9APIC|nr:bifunctional Lysine methyltransferase/S-adenosyl-L-methionine-dependent methyltransferase superfamily [Babesia duncani]
MTTYNLERLARHSRTFKVDYDDDTVVYSVVPKEESNNFSTDALYIKVADIDATKASRVVRDGEYQGGYTIWEATWVLLSFLHEHLEKNSNLALELGCGNGLCGLLALELGYNVMFQDLNQDVFQEALIPNYLLSPMGSSAIGPDAENVTVQLEDLDCSENIKCQKIMGYEVEKKRHNSLEKYVTKHKVQLLACEWSALCNEQPPGLSAAIGNCKVILASEVTYLQRNFESLSRVLELFLAADGVAYVASKRLYFGLDGGTFSFVEYINTHVSNGGCGSHKLIAKVAATKRPSNSANIIDIVEIRKL